MIFFTADLHLGHGNIIKYCNRPFNNVDEMDQTLIKNWNETVSDNDVVYILGDFCFKKYGYYIRQFNGHIIELQGDHDNFKNNNFLMNIKVGHTSITLCHWCMRVWRKSHYNSWHLYGHSHGNLSPIGKSWDVGVDNNDFRPLSFNDIEKIMSCRPDNPNLVKK